MAFENLANSHFKKKQRIQVENMFTLARYTPAGQIQLEFCQKWLETNKMTQTPPTTATPVLPTVRFNVASLDEFFPYQKCDLGSIFGAIASELERSLIYDGPRVEIELRGMGRIYKTGAKIGFVPAPTTATPFYQPFDVQMLQKFPLGKSAKNINFKLPKIRGEETPIDRPLEVLVSQDNTNYEKKNPIKLKLKGNKGGPRNGQENSTKNGAATQSAEAQQMNSGPVDPAFQAAKEQHEQMVQRFKSGTMDNFDFDKTQYFSQVYKKPSEIWNQQYLRPNRNPTEQPKILERHSQTRAKPVALMFNSLSVSSRVAINYTPLSKYL